ncbi:MAG: hypothetical protein Q8N09_05415 [Thermodesulfovibrionia bacterium]|nr:hypothetical protein [Thermodesulfovibrionia bacterium]
MSLLADLLSKIKHSQSKREIPPNLRHIVSASAQQSARKRKIILISVFFITAVTSGIFAIYFMNSITGMLNKGQGLGVSGQGSEVRKQEEARSQKPETESPKIEASLRPMGSQNELTGDGAVKPNISHREREKIASSEVKTQNLENRAEIAEPPFKDTTQHTEHIKQSREHKAESTEQKIQPSEIQNVRAAVDAYLYSARNHEIKKDYSKALSDYRKVLEIDKNNFSVMNNIAYILLQIGLINESIEYSQMAVNIKKDYVPALINLAVANARTGNISAAETYLNSALMIEPDNQFVLLNCAILYEKKGDYTRASEYFLKLNRLGNVTGSLGLAMIYEKQDKKEEALKIYKNIYSLNFIDNETRQIVRQRIILLSGKAE